MADKENIYSLIWHTRMALNKIGYAPKTLVYYDRSGFAKVLEAHIFAGTETYSQKICAKVALDTHKLVARGLRHRYQGVRKAVALLEEYGNDVLFSEKQSVGVPKMALPYRKVYQGFTDDEIIRLLAAVDRDTIIGKRDYAMMVLAAQTGLRGVDVIKLKRSDIDWRKREINIMQSKTGAALCVALEIESGNALYDYLLNARPESDIPNVFLRYHHPIRAMNPPSIQGIVKKIYGSCRH